jgi:uncharacterized membrane protein YadS
VLTSTFALAYVLGTRLFGLDRTTAVGAKHRLHIPWFAFGFIGMVLFNSLALLPQSARTALVDVDTFILAMAMAALGLTTHISAIRNAGIKPLLLAGVLFVWLILGGGLINALVARAELTRRYGSPHLGTSAQFDRQIVDHTPFAGSPAGDAYRVA